MRSRIAVLLAILPFAGCVVARATYDAEVARNRALAHDLEQREASIDELDLRVRHLERTGENLEIERGALDEERIRLLNEIEDLRAGNEVLQLELVKERDVRETREAEIADLSGTYASLVEELEREVESGKIEIHRLRGRLQVRALDQILFDSGKTEIKPEGREVLASVAREIRKLPGHKIRVEGHTDSVPIATELFPSNWELSAARAARVVRFLLTQRLEPDRLSAEGFGPYQPIASNGTPAGRARNRRIEIVLLPQDED